MAEYREQVGARIRQLRLARGLTQDQLADLVGVQEKTVSRWEKGRHSGYMSNIKALADALEVEQEEITGTPPAPLGLGARADQVDGGFEEFRAYVANIEARLERIETALTDTDGESLLTRQSEILERIEILVATLPSDETTRRLLEAIRGAA